MKQNLGGVIWRLAIFMVVCVLGIAALFMVFASLRFQELRNYNAIFTNVSGLQNGNFVRIAGVEVGKVKNMSINPDATVSVEFAADPSVVLTKGSHAQDPLGQPDRRPLPGAGGGRWRSQTAQAGRNHPGRQHHTGAEPGRADRRLPPAYSAPWILRRSTS